MLAVKRTLKELTDGALFPFEHQVHGRGAVVLGEPEKQDWSSWIVKVLVGQVEMCREPISGELYVDSNRLLN